MKQSILYPVLFLLLAALPAALHAQEPAAMVTAVEGKASVRQDGVTRALEIGMELAAGDEVTATDGGVSLVFMSGDLMELAAGDVLTLGADMESSTLSAAGETRGVTQDDGVTVAEEGFGKANPGKWQNRLAHIYGVRGDATVAPVAPRLAVASPKPVFYWFDSDSAVSGTEQQYTIVLRDGEGRELFRADAAGHAFEMNSFAPAAMPEEYVAEPGKRYSWSVSRKGEDPAGSPANYIYIDEAGLQLAAAKQQQLARLRDTGTIRGQAYHTLMAMYYLDERERLYSDAMSHLLALEAIPEGENYARAQLALLLNRFGNEVAAAASWYARKSR